MSDLKYDKETKELLCKYDYKYFVELNIGTERYSEENVDIIYRTYKDTKQKIKEASARNRKQYLLYLEGHVGKMFNGGLLPSLFNLNEIRQRVFLDFPAIGENWAYFEAWQKYYNRKFTKKKLWNGTVLVGSILGIFLSILKLVEVLTPYFKK